MRETVRQRLSSILIALRPVHGLEKELPKIQLLERFGIESRLRIDQLELVAVAERERCPGFGADANPIETGRRFLGAVRLHCDLETSVVQRVDRGGVELEQRLAAGAHDESARALSHRPPRGDSVGEIAGRGELAAVRGDAKKISVAEIADCLGTIRLAARPQIAAREAAEDRGSPRVRPFALQRVEDLFDGVHALNVSSGVRDAGFGKALQAQSARVAAAARHARRARIVAALGDRIVDAES